MDVEAIDLGAIRARVRDMEKTPGKKRFKSVGGVLEAADAMENIPGRPPMAFVAIASERGQPNTTQGIHDQKVNSVIAVLMCLATERRDDAVQLTDDAEETRLAVIGTLTGWTPPGARKALNYDGYRVVRMSQGLAWLEAAFSTGWRLRG